MFSVYELISTDQKLVFAMSSFFEEHIYVYDRSRDHLKSPKLGFELKAGMLKEFNLHSLHKERWLFSWPYRNQFKIFDKNFTLEYDFSISDLPGEAKGQIIQPKIPASATGYREKVWKAGTCMPSGSFFTSIILLEHQQLLVQLGTQTGSPRKALIISLSGEILQKIELQIAGKVLEYSEQELYMLDTQISSIVAHRFKSTN